MNILKRLADNLRKRKIEWDSLCKRCGICCYGKESRLFRTIIKLSEPCDFFNTRTKLCNVYERRFSACRYCAKVTIFHAIFSRSLPAGCGYVEKYRHVRFFGTAQIKGGTVGEC